jgi:hypothetical protein
MPSRGFRVDCPRVALGPLPGAGSTHGFMLSDGNTFSMDIPDLVQQALGGEEIQAGISLDDEDAVCLTPTRTLVYKSDGLLSDEQLTEFSHDVERIAVSEGHRKTKFILEYFDGTRSFTVPPSRDEKVLQLLLEGVLRVESVIEDRESVVDVYRFSELTLIVTEGRLIKLIGAQVWNDDYEVYPFERVTGLAFERASVATSVVVEVEGRPQRVKVPNDTAPIVRQTIEKALFAYYDVASLEELNRVVDDGSGAETVPDDRDEIAFGSDFDPLVTDDAEPADPDGTLEDISTGPGNGARQDDTAGASASASADASTGAGAGASPGEGSADPNRPADGRDQSAGADATPSTPAGAERQEQRGTESARASGASGGAARDGDDGAGTSPAHGSESRAEPQSRTEPGTRADRQTTDASGGVEPATSEDLSAVADRVEELTEAVERQNELLTRQHRALRQLVDELQSE